MSDYITEINEAIEAGKRAYSSLSEAERYLSSARNWGLFDMFGGGFISGLIKHSKLNSASQLLADARNEVENFKDELKDVSVYVDFPIEFDSFTQLIDLLCDSFLVDFLVQDKIVKAQRSVEAAKRQIEKTLKRLESMR